MVCFSSNVHVIAANKNVSIHLASLLSISLQPSGFGPNIVGQKQDVTCSVLLSSDVDPNSVKLSWRNKEDIVTADSRVTIITSSVNSTLNASSITTTIRFDPLFENDEGKYTCYASVNGLLLFESIQLEHFWSK